MAFTITPDLAYMFNTFSMIEVNGISYLWGALFAILITLIISTEAYHIKITALPTVLMLHTIGIYQHILIILIAGAMFVTTALSFKLLTGGVQAVANAVTTTANTVYDAGKLTKERKRYGSFADALTMRKFKSELDHAKQTSFKDKFNVNAKAFKGDFGDVLYSKTDRNIIEDLQPLKIKQEIDKKDLIEKNKAYNENLDKLMQIKIMDDARATKTGKSMSIQRKWKDKQSQQFITQSDKTLRKKDLTNYNTSLDIMKSEIDKVKGRIKWAMDTGQSYQHQLPHLSKLENDYENMKKLGRQLFQ